MRDGLAVRDYPLAMYCIEVMLLMLLNAQIVMIPRNESMKIKRQFLGIYNS